MAELQARAIAMITRPGGYYGTRIAALIMTGCSLGILLAQIPLEAAACCLLVAAGALTLIR
jgi:hypothetical protein